MYPLMYPVQQATLFVRCLFTLSTAARLVVEQRIHNSSYSKPGTVGYSVVTHLLTLKACVMSIHVATCSYMYLASVVTHV